MSEELNNTGEQQTEAAAPSANVEKQALTEQESGQSVSNDGQVVPLSALQSERAKRHEAEERNKRYEEENKMMREHYALYSQQQKQQQQARVQDDFAGLDDNELVTVGEYKKHTARMADQFKMTLAEMQMAQKHPDYQQVITKYLPDVLKQNPRLRQTLESTQDYELAYHLATNSEAYRSDKDMGANKSADAKRIVENAERAGSLSSMGTTAPVADAKRYKDMSDSEFRKLVNKNLGLI